MTEREAMWRRTAEAYRAEAKQLKWDRYNDSGSIRAFIRNWRDAARFRRSMARIRVRADWYDRPLWMLGFPPFPVNLYRGRYRLLPLYAQVRYLLWRLGVR